jgi:A/G-specific adenine glycosylase
VRFLAWFPSLQALAQAPIESVLEVWQGLGYYQRAHNLHRAAQRLHAQGGFEALWTRPDPLQGLLALPGIGPYTARAILAFSEKGAYLPVDGNLVRVLSRLFADPTPATDRAYYQGQADGLPLAWRQRKVAFALMDLLLSFVHLANPNAFYVPFLLFVRG